MSKISAEPSGAKADAPSGDSVSWAVRLPKLSLRTLGKVVVSFALSLGAWYLLRGFYNEFLAGCGRILFPWFGGPEVQPLIVAREGLFALNTGLRAPGGQGMQFVQLEPEKLHWNGIVFLTLLLLVPVQISAARWLRVNMAILVMVGLHVVNYVLALAIVCAQAYLEQGLRFGNESVMNIVAGTHLASASVLAPAIPFLLVGFVVLGASRSRSRPPRKPARAANVGRNDPCPCGSGKKFKQCCGG